MVASGLSLVPGVGEVFAPLWFGGNIVSLALTGNGLSHNIGNYISNSFTTPLPQNLNDMQCLFPNAEGMSVSFDEE